MNDWLAISLVACLGGAATLAFILGACKIADRADRQARRDLEVEVERVIRHGGQHPWIKP